MENRSGPWKEPCRTPYFIGRGSKEKLKNLTGDLLRIYKLSHFRAL